MVEFLKWYFSLDLGGTFLFAVQAVILMMLCGLPIVATRKLWRDKIRPMLKAWTARAETQTAENGSAEKAKQRLTRQNQKQLDLV